MHRYVDYVDALLCMASVWQVLGSPAQLGLHEKEAGGGRGTLGLIDLTASNLLHRCVLHCCGAVPPSSPDVHDINFGVIDVDFVTSTVKAQVHGQTGVVMEHSYDFDALVPPKDDGSGPEELVPANGKAELGYFVQLTAVVVAAATVVVMLPGLCCWRVAKAIRGSDAAAAAAAEAASPRAGNKHAQKQNKKTK